MRNKCLSFLLIIGILFSLNFIHVNASTTGVCGVNLIWTYESGTLSISGSGDMYEWDNISQIPWYSLRDNIKNIVIDEKVTRITKDAFYGTAYYNNDANWENGILYIGSYLVDAKGVTDCKIKEGTTRICDYAFSYCTDMWNITIPETVTTIGNRSFYNCSGIRRIQLPESLTGIYDYAFYNCYVLYTVTIPVNVSYIGNEVFSHCPNLTNISVVRENPYFSSIDGILFNKDRTSIVRFPENRTKDIYYLPYTVKKLENGAFSGCKGIGRVIVPKSVKYIGDNVFFNCVNLTSIVLPANIENIGRRAFYNTGYYNITGNWEKGILYIGQYLIAANSAEEHVIKDGTVYIAAGAFKDCETMTSVIIPGSVTSIGESAFSGCDKLISVNIPKGVTNIGKNAFYECTGLLGISIPVSVKKIGDMAFYNCIRLMGVFYAGSESQWKSISFGAYNNHITGRKIYYNYEIVPAGFVFEQNNKTQAEIEEELKKLGVADNTDMEATLEVEQALENERAEERGQK